jgi:hypothetical protein
MQQPRPISQSARSNMPPDKSLKPNAYRSDLGPHIVHESYG